MNLSVGNKTRVYILTGLPYAGKTTLRTELMKRFGFGVASVDEEIDKNEFQVEQMTQNDWNLVYSQAYDKLKQLLNEGKTVILDNGNLKRSERDTARQIAELQEHTDKLPSKLIHNNLNIAQEVWGDWEEGLDDNELKKMDRRMQSRVKKRHERFRNLFVSLSEEDMNILKSLHLSSPKS